MKLARLRDQLDALFMGVAAMVFGLGPLVAGVGVFARQVYAWLHTGEWTSQSVLDFLRWADVRRDWIADPTTWLGLWKVLEWLPLSVTSMAFGVMMLVSYASERRSRPKPTGPDPHAAFWEFMKGPNNNEP